MDGSTIDAESAQQISKQIKAAGAQYLEAPVSGMHCMEDSQTSRLLVSLSRQRQPARGP